MPWACARPYEPDPVGFNERIAQPREASTYLKKYPSEKASPAKPAGPPWMSKRSGAAFAPCGGAMTQPSIAPFGVSKVRRTGTAAASSRTRSSLRCVTRRSFFPSQSAT